jgi:hypothetical protein
MISLSSTIISVSQSLVVNNIQGANCLEEVGSTHQGRIQDFKLGGGAHLKKLRRAEGGAKMFWGISCEKSRSYAKKIIFFPILGGARAGCPPRWIRPCSCCSPCRCPSSHPSVVAVWCILDQCHDVVDWLTFFHLYNHYIYTGIYIYIYIYV